jgi:hypothetical protein
VGSLAFTFFVSSILLISWPVEGFPAGTIPMPRQELGQEWARTWNEGTTDRVLDIAVWNGTFYVLGATEGPGTDGYDRFITAYDDKGYEMWRRALRSSIEGSLRCIAADGSGIYAAGSINNTTTRCNDVLLRKFDFGLGPVWNFTWGGPADDGANDIAVDSKGIFLTGMTASFGSKYTNVLTVMVNWNLTLGWYDFWGADRYEAGISLAINGFGVFVAGTTNSFSPSSTMSHLFVLAYNRTGERQWISIWNQGYSAYGYAVSASSDAVYAFGSYPDNGTYSENIFCLKYDVWGNASWNRTWGKSDRRERIEYSAADSTGIYGAGFVSNYGYQMLMLKFEPDGNEAWNYTVPADNSEQAAGLVIHDGAIYTARSSIERRSPGTSIILMKQGLDRKLTWEAKWTSGAYGIHANGLAKDDLALYMVGEYDRHRSGRTDLLLLKFALNGSFIWARTWGRASGNESGRAIVVDPEGIFIAGKAETRGPGEYDILVMKYDRDGSLVWNVTQGGDGGEEAIGMAVDSTGIYVSGRTIRTIYNSVDGILLKFDRQGKFAWERLWGSTGWDEPVAPALGPSGIYCAGTRATVSAAGSGLVVKYDYDGNPLWNLSIDSVSDSSVQAVAADASGVYLAGYLEYRSPAYESFLMKIDPNGRILWNRTSLSIDVIKVAGLMVDANNIYSYGTSSGKAIILGYGMDGTPLWERLMGSKGQCSAKGLAFDSLDFYLAADCWVSSEKNDEITLAGSSKTPLLMICITAPSFTLAPEEKAQIAIRVRDWTGLPLSGALVETERVKIGKITGFVEDPPGTYNIEYTAERFSPSTETKRTVSLDFLIYTRLGNITGRVYMNVTQQPSPTGSLAPCLSGMVMIVAVVGIVVPFRRRVD